ncbi:MAG TPA: LysR family transcriptional regulator [Xanthobacteraceae bacterium]
MRYAHLRHMDLGLLAALQALIEERSITRAAERMFLSQPAMSRALDRLQDIFGDELLVRTGHGYEPTHRARQLQAELDHVLPHLSHLLRGDHFDPATATDSFRIAATDFAASVLFPDLVARVTKAAPHVALEIHPWDDSVFRRLEGNALDLALWANSAPREFRTQVLFRDCFMCLVRRRHPLGTAPLTLERYLAYPHALVALAHQRQGVLDKMLEDKGIERRVQLRIPYFASAAWAIEQSDMILTVPKRLACRLQKISQTTMLEPPIELAEFRYIQVWHPRLDADPAHQWLRHMFSEVAAIS